MALKTLQNKYDALLQVFEEVGIKLNESQKESLDTFMLDFQAKLTETRDNAIKATKKIVEEKLEKEFKEVFESITAKQKEIYEKSSKIDLLKSQHVMTEALDQYLTEYVAEILPKRDIVDYARMQKLEQIHESLKEMLVVTEEEVEDKLAEVQEEYEEKKEENTAELKKKLAECDKVIKESKENTKKLTEKYSKLLKESLIAEKTKNLPIVESKKLKEKLSTMTVEQIEENYKTVLESVQDEVEQEIEVTQEEKNLEEAIANILEGDDSEKTGNDEKQETEIEPETSDDESEVTSDEEDSEEGVQITESMMKNWIETLSRLTPQK